MEQVRESGGTSLRAGATERRNVSIRRRGVIVQSPTGRLGAVICTAPRISRSMPAHITGFTAAS